jgi:hypothetical protein
MERNIPFGVASTVAIARQKQVVPDKIVAPLFGRVCKVIWPVKTAAQLAAIADAKERTAERWLSGEFEAPAIVIAAVIVEITKR